MSSNHNESLPGSCWYYKSTHHEPHLNTASENGALFVLPDPNLNLGPVEISEHAYKGNGWHLQEPQKSRVDLLCDRILLPVSPSEWVDMDHFIWLSQQPNHHNHPSATTPIHMTLGRQTRLECTTPEPGGQTEAKRGSKTNNRERKKTSDERRAHSIIERRYRDKVNNKLKELYHTLREVRYLQQSRNAASDRTIISEPSGGMKKSDVINDAITYIHESEINFRHMADEIQSLRNQLSHFRDKGIA
ncbi:uncharacterized protein PV07_09633 [Cladophialophora immunda]|uniref:BHLH domain-containing protein n=1 Tax=Cladophialophora immunda TaxID=569365 RepID=A0A0D1ZFG7_9EURO|nr:uncharacterized protein PV07_09633 [Cladophialophora immunda]KIW26546.1 hypothetical protein PV07_09633 [Cladophialophora immunda]OQV02405.1 Helix-loop-helix DNA-binding domain-containing protein [Cladophialophora immunda]